MIVVKTNRSLESRIRKVAEKFGVKIVALRNENRQYWKKRLEKYLEQNV